MVYIESAEFVDMSINPHAVSNAHDADPIKTLVNTIQKNDSFCVRGNNRMIFIPFSLGKNSPMKTQKQYVHPIRNDLIKQRTIYLASG